MVTLLAAIQEVELVSDESWLRENLGPLLLAVAAVFAAALAAWVASRNHKRQLMNDRILQRQDHIREVVDAASVTLADAHFAVQEYRFDIGVHGDGLDQAGMEQKRAELFVDAQDKIDAIKHQSHRLRIRFGEEHEIPAANERAGDELQAMLDDSVAKRGGNYTDASTLSPEDPGEEERWSSSVNAAFREFRKKCFTWFEGRPSKRPSLGDRLRSVR